MAEASDVETPEDDVIAVPQTAPPTSAQEAGEPGAAGLGPAHSRREVRDIQSPANATFKHLAALQSSRGVRRAGMALVAGVRPVQEILRDFPERCVAWVGDSTVTPPQDIPAELAWYRAQRDLFRRLDVSGTGGPLLLVRVPEFPPWTEADWAPGCTLFIPFQDPENVGASLRSAAAFGVERVVLLEEAAHPFHPKSARAAGGSPLMRLRFYRGPALRALQPEKFPILALSTAGRDLAGFDFPAIFGLLPGLEGPGLPPAFRGPEALRIPVAPGVESLNAATATAIALYVWRQSLPAGPGSAPNA